MIEVSNLSKSFPLNRQQRGEMQTDARSVAAVKDVSFTCVPGRIFSLLGPNGAGKTTILRILATILLPDSGVVRVAGADAVTNPAAVRAKLGFLTGSTGLYLRLTPEEVVAYFAKLYGMDKQTCQQRKEELFDRLDIHDFARKRIGSLSTGMKQKVSIARTLLHDPEVIIFDEPTAGLDVITAGHIIQLIRESKEKGKTLIFSSHIMSEVDLLCDDLAIVHKGSLLFNASMDDFRRQMQTENLTAEFIRIIGESSSKF
jgi:sodium transport system ATP-binding protein